MKAKRNPSRKVLQIVAIMCLGLAITTPTQAAMVPHASWTKLPLANGFGAAVYDRVQGRLIDAWTRPYAQADANRVTPDLLFDLFFGVASTSGGFWLTTTAPITTHYENGTGILTVVRDVAQLRFTERWFAPMGIPAAAVVGMITVKNLGMVDTGPLKLFSLHNFHVGPTTPEANSDNETITRDATSGALIETAGNRMAIVLPLASPARFQASPPNPYATMPATSELSNTVGAGPQSDAISAFEWTRAEGLAPGAEWSVGIVLGVADSGSVSELLGLLTGVGTSAEAALTAERADWKTWHEHDILPAGLAGDRLALARQSLAWLRMAQVREPDAPSHRPFGQILASLPPGGWNRTWVRDQAYAAVALAVSGHPEEAAAAARFVHKASVGTYTAEVGGPYGVSVCRYYGGGAEESDGNPADEGPNIEFDGFGLQLWLAHEIAARAPAALGAAEAWSSLKAGAADVLVRLIEPTGLVAADSGIWERHWNGRQKHFTNTDATAVLGLCAAARLAEAADDPSASSYREAARRVAAAMASLLVSEGVLVGNLEEMPSGHALDAAVVEAFNWDVMAQNGTIAGNTLAALHEGLGMNTGPGLCRNDDGDAYDRREWVFIDLRFATALQRAGKTTQSEEIVDWVVAQSRANHDLIAELYDEVTADYAGAVPMGGFGAGAYLLWLHRHEPIADVASCLAGEDIADDGALEDLIPDVVEAVSVPDDVSDTADASLAADPSDPGPKDAASQGFDPAGRAGGGCSVGTTQIGSPLLWLVSLLVWWAVRTRPQRGIAVKAGSR